MKGERRGYAELADELREKDRVGFEWDVVLTVRSQGVSVRGNCAFFYIHEVVLDDERARQLRGDRIEQAV